MAVTHSTAARNDMAEAVAALANAGTTPNLTIHQTSGDTLLATILLGVDFTVTAGTGVVATSAANGASATAVATGTAGYARVNASAGTEIWRGSVTATGGGGDVTISSTSITSGDTVTLTSDVTWTAPP